MFAKNLVNSRLRATVAVAMSNYIEAGSIIAIATSLSLWQARFHFGNGVAGDLAAFSPNAFGAAVGAIIGGPLCDRFGRKFIYTYDLLVYMVGMLIVIFAQDTAMLFIGFMTAGIAVGAGVTAAWTYIAEVAPDDRRAYHVGIAQLAWSIGPLLGFLLAALVSGMGLTGARIIFGWLFVVALVTWIIRRGLSESEIWSEQKATDARSMTLSESLKGLFSRRVNWAALGMLFVVYGAWCTVAGQAGIFMPRVYAASGFHSYIEQDLIQALLWGMTCLLTFVGFMRFGDRVSRRRLFAIGGVMGIAGWAVLAWVTPSTGTLLFFAIVWGASAGIGAQAFYGLWTSELFATQYRAGAQGVLFTLARIIVGTLSLFFPTLLASLGLSKLGFLLVGLLGLSLLAGALFAPDTRGKSLRQIELERYGESLEHDARARGLETATA